MASKYLQKFPIPSGFQQILSDFTREVLRDQPQNIIEYAAKYFEMLEKGGKHDYDSKYNVRKDDKKYELAYNAKNAEDITKRATNITSKLNNVGGSVAPGGVIGSQKTVHGIQTSNYMNSLSNKFANQTEEQQMLRQAVTESVNRLFAQIDLDRNGYLASKQIEHFVREVVADIGGGNSFNENDIEGFIEMVDNDRDGRISKAELIVFVMGLFNAE